MRWRKAVDGLDLGAKSRTRCLYRRDGGNGREKPVLSGAGTALCPEVNIRHVLIHRIITTVLTSFLKLGRMSTLAAFAYTFLANLFFLVRFARWRDSSTLSSALCFNETIVLTRPAAITQIRAPP